MENINQEQMDEGTKEFISLSLIAGLLSMGNIIKAENIVKNIPNKATHEQIQNGLKNAEEFTKTYNGYTLLQIANILTRTLYAEAKGESLEGKKMVATVIWNRAGEKIENIPTVCFAKSQFSAWNKFSDKSAKTYSITIPRSVFDNPISKKAWNQCKEITNDILAGNFSSLGNWNSYLNPKTANKDAVNGWGSTMSNQKTVGNHKFGYQKHYDGKLSKIQVKKPEFPSSYKVQKTDKGVSYIAKNLISKGLTPIKDLKKLTDKIIALNNLGSKAIIHPGDELNLPMKESSRRFC